LNGNDLKRYRKARKLSQGELARQTHVPQANISRLESSGAEIKKVETLRIFEEFFKNEVLAEGEPGAIYAGIRKENGRREEPGKTTVTNMVFEPDAILLGEAAGPGKESQLIPLGNNKYGLTVHLVPVKAYGGYLDNYADPEYHETLDKHTLTVVGNHRGFYLAFAMKGKSMENWTTEEMARASIPEDWIVTGRDIPRHHWRNKLHLHRWDFYIIVHKDGIVTKQIIEHNLEEGWIICHSLNPDKKLYPDFKLMLDDCLQILNVVQKSVSL
jgi:transcriptional regulator with XRE-family HTH domain